jgi:hypothetical protein
MKLPKHRVELASSKEETRFTLKGVFADVEKKRLIATDGHMMVIAAAEFAPDDQSGIISLRTIREARAAARRIPRAMRTTFSLTVRLLKRVVTIKTHDNELSVIQRPTGEFPKYEKVLPTHFKGAPVAILGAELLRRLMEAVTTSDMPNHTDSVAIWIDHEPGKFTDKCVMIAPLEGNALGILMPMRDQSGITAEKVFERITPEGTK